MLSIAAWMLPSALLRVAAPPARPIRTRRNHSPLDGSNHTGCMSSARAINRRSRRDTIGATTPVKTAVWMPKSCGDGPYFRSSSLAAGPPGRRRSAVTLSVSFASAACPPLLRIPPGLVTRCKREKRILALEGASSPRSVSRLMLRLAAWMLPSVLLRVATPPARLHMIGRSHPPLDGSSRAGCMSPA